MISLGLTLLIFILPGILNILLIRFWQRSWWRNRAIRSTICLLPLFAAINCLLWWISFQSQLPSWLPNPGIVTVTFWLLQLVLVPSILASGLLHRTEFVLSEKLPPSPTRRSFLFSTAALIPCLASGVVLGAGAGALTPARVTKRVLRFRHLPPELAGLRILQISDLHLAGFVTLSSLTDILEHACELSPDLIVVTGDFADDLRLLPGALTQLDEFGAPYGVIAVPGNHEHGNGIRKILQAFDASRITMLINQGVSIHVGDACLYVGGIDDPMKRLESESGSEFYLRSVADAFVDSDQADFRILLSHRPDAFDAAASNQIELTFAGHTHGGQIGLNGRSLFSYQGTAYPWGLYEQKGSQLYTSSGAGHWIPARLNCPAEAPVFELQSV
jgi:uncharacterized protein